MKEIEAIWTDVISDWGVNWPSFEGDLTLKTYKMSFSALEKVIC